MNQSPEFELADFLPYLLNIAAEQTGKVFQDKYKQKYGLLRTDWRVLFHLGLYGPLTATEICVRARLHKTKVSRAVQRLGERRLLVRATSPNDRRVETLTLTTAGERIFSDLRNSAEKYDQQLALKFNDAENDVLRKCLKILMES